MNNNSRHVELRMWYIIGMVAAASGPHWCSFSLHLCNIRSYNQKEIRYNTVSLLGMTPPTFNLSYVS